MRERKGDEVFSDDFLPQVLHRDEHLELLSNCFEPIKSDKTPENIFLIGPSGTGKTVSVKKFLNNVEHGVYLNCWNHRSTHELLRKLLLSLGEVVHGRESTSELAEKLREKTKEKKLTVCLDHIEHLKENEIIEKLTGIGLCVILVSDAEESYTFLSEKIRNSIPSVIKITDYTIEQVHDILMDRAKEALTEGSYTDPIISKIAEMVKGNAAEGINLLMASALRAETAKKNTIDETDLEHDCPLAELTKDQKIILKILEEWKELPSGKLFAFYRERAKFAKGERTFRKYMEVLCEKGFVKADGDKRGRVYEIVEGEKVEDNSDSGSVQRMRG